ncbi:MAG TPA: hypothetical protein VHI13_11700 [Candidatus Kapabacteria bacterium]|nr:hypothetical protein [Candidatus Kapabacteria bacterium]
MAATIVDKVVPDGDDAVDYTVRGPMCVLAVRDSRNRCVRAIARELKGAARSDEEAVRLAFDHVVRTIPYRPDPKRYELVVAPVYTLGCRKPYPGYTPHGDCDCQSTALASLLFAMGYRPVIRVVAWRKPDYTHVNLQVTLPDGQTIPLDTVMKSSGFGRQKPAVYREHLYRCPMVVRALADDVAPQEPASRTLGGKPGGCGCAACRSHGAGACGGRRGCCPRNGASASGSPVTVNVNTGSIDSRRWIDSSERAEITTDGSRWLQFPAQQMPGQREPVTHEARRRSVVRIASPPVQRQVYRQVVRRNSARPIVLREVQSRTPLRSYKEFT